MDDITARLDALEHHTQALEHHTQALEHHNQALQQQTHTITRRLRWQRNAALLMLGLGLATWALSGGSPQAQEESSPQALTLEQRVGALEKKLKYLTTFIGTDGRPWVQITGANLRVVNGTGQTATANGVGNLVVGYNELRGGGNTRTGSHNVVVGREHNYSRFGGLVVGLRNTISGTYAVVNGGHGNTASGGQAVINGGFENTASSEYALVSGGNRNTASGIWAAVSGGEYNTASERASTVSGGIHNTASGRDATVSGGASRRASGDYDWVAGSLFEDQ